VIALEEVEPELVAPPELLPGLDLLGKQTHREGAQLPDLVLELAGREECQVHLDNLDEVVERLERRGELVVIQGKLEAGRS